MKYRYSKLIHFATYGKPDMWEVKSDAIGGFNEFLRKQKELPGTADVTLTLFNHEYDIIQEGVPLQKIKDLDSNTYVPDGMTALLDAVGRTIDAVGNRLSKTEEDKKPEKVIVCILTDGNENQSKEYKKDQIKSKIEHQKKKYQWEFIFLGADIDAFAEAGGIGVPKLNTMSFDKSKTRVYYSSNLSDTVRDYRAK